jgi:uncharacterized protein (PEP-CTERM system associated)
LTFSGGYERNRFALTQNEGSIYGFGVSWRPTDRTLFDAAWEHRFFGDSYHVQFEHRTPRTVWTLNASRDIQTYPELIAQAAPGTVVPLLLDFALRSRIPDPAERLRFIVDYIQSQGLPLVLNEPLTIYNQQVYLQEYALASFGLLGARNTVFFSAYRTKLSPIEASIGGLQQVFNDTEQVGGGVSWSYRLASLSTLSASLDGSTTTGETRAETNQWTVRAVLTRSVGPRTTGYAGARYQALDSNVSSGYREAAIFAGVHYSFR